MNPSNPSIFARPLFVFSFGITLLIVAAMYSSRSHAASISLDVPDCTTFTLSGGPNFTLTCVKSTPGTPNCSITKNTVPSNSNGGSVTLSGSCSGFSPIWWTWVKSNSNFAYTQTLNDSLPANGGTTTVSTTYGITACDASSVCAPTAWTTVDVPGSTTPPGGSGPVSCSGFTKTLYVDLPWVNSADPIRLVTNNYGGFNSSDALVIKLNTPAGASVSTGYIAGGEYGGGAKDRLAIISASPCDFSTTGATTIYNAQGGTSFNFALQVGGSQVPYQMLLQPGTPYYLNVKNVGCPAGNQCNMSIDFHRPPGT